MGHSRMTIHLLRAIREKLLAVLTLIVAITVLVALNFCTDTTPILSVLTSIITSLFAATIFDIRDSYKNSCFAYNKMLEEARTLHSFLYEHKEEWEDKWVCNRVAECRDRILSLTFGLVYDNDCRELLKQIETMLLLLHQRNGEDIQAKMPLCLERLGRFMANS